MSFHKFRMVHYSLNIIIRIAINDSHTLEYLKYFTSAYMFTNSINPIQCATALAQLRILKSERGTRLRTKILENYFYMKKKVNELGFEVIGQPSAICPVLIKNEIVNRLLTRLMLDEGVHVNGIEYPVVKIGKARLRVNL